MIRNRQTLNINLRTNWRYAVVTFLLIAVSATTSFSESSEAGTDRKVFDSLAGSYDKGIVFNPADGNGTLEDYLKYAALQSQALRRAFYQWKAAMEKTGYAGALPDPMLSFGYYIENVETRVGPQEKRLGLKQSFPWFGSLDAKKEMAVQQANAAYRMYQAEKLKVYYSVKAAYYDYYYLGRDIALTAENMELLKFWESVARVKYQVALKQHPDVIKAQVELGKLEDRLLTLKDKIEPTVARLRAILNLPDSVDIPVPSSLTVREVKLDADSLLSDALINNPNLVAMTHIIERERSGLRLAKKASLPNFTVGVDYVQTGPALDPNMPESGKDPWIVGVGINLPLWFGKNNAKKREAAAKLLSAEYNYSEAQNQIAALVERLVFQYSDAARKAKLYRDGLVPKAEQALNASYTAYQAGEMDFLNVLDAQRQLLDFQLQMEKALSDLATRQAEIEMIVGKELIIQ